MSNEINHSKQAPVLLSTLQALKELLITNNSPSSKNEKSSQSPLLDYFLDVTPRLLRLTQFKEQMVDYAQLLISLKLVTIKIGCGKLISIFFQQVRMLALQCLQRLAKFPIHVIQPLKETVSCSISIVNFQLKCNFYYSPFHKSKKFV